MDHRKQWSWTGFDIPRGSLQGLHSSIDPREFSIEPRVGFRVCPGTLASLAPEKVENLEGSGQALETYRRVPGLARTFQGCLSNLVDHMLGEMHRGNGLVMCYSYILRTGSLMAFIEG